MVVFGFVAVVLAVALAAAAPVLAGVVEVVVLLLLLSAVLVVEDIFVLGVFSLFHVYLFLLESAKERVRERMVRSERGGKGSGSERE